MIKMKISIKTILIVVLISILPFCEKDKQTNDNPILIDSPMVGSWKFIDVDSCFAYVIQYTEIKKTKLQNFNGSINFLNTGKGSLNSTLELYCNYSSFTWKFKSPDTLFINTLAYPYDACISFPTNDSIFIKLESCYPRRGVSVWYEVRAAKFQ